MDRHLMEVRFLVECGKMEHAEKLLASYADRHHGWNSAARLLMAQLALNQGNFVDAEAHLSTIGITSDDITLQQHQVLLQQLSSLKLTFMAAEEALSTNSWQVARQQAQACLAGIQPSSMPGLAVKVLLMQATASAGMHDHENAVQALDLALQLQPNCKPALWQRAAAHAAVGSHQASFLDLRRLSTLQPDYPGLLEALQQAAHACSKQRRAAVQAAAPQRRYSRITRGGHGQQAYGSAGPSGVGGACSNSSSQWELYKALGLDLTATMEQIRQAYKRLAAKLHPDKHFAASQEERNAAEEEFKAISAAYQALTKAAAV